MSKLPFMPVFVADFIGDTNHLSTEQTGAYFLLLCALWRAGGRLPNEKNQLSRITRLSTRRWHLIGQPVVDEFFFKDGESIGQKRLDLELERIDERFSKHSVAGKKGGRPRRTDAPKRVSDNALTDSPKSDSDKGSASNDINDLEKARLFSDKKDAKAPIPIPIENAYAPSRSTEGATAFSPAPEPQAEPADIAPSGVKRQGAGRLPVEHEPIASAEPAEKLLPYQRNAAERARRDALIDAANRCRPSFSPLSPYEEANAKFDHAADHKTGPPNTITLTDFHHIAPDDEET